MAVREAHLQALTLRAAAMAAGHVRRSPRLVDEHEAFRFKIDLSVEPVPTLLQDVGTVLPDRVPGLFCA